MRQVTDRVGELQVATGVVHLALGLVGFRRPLAAIARDGVVGVVEGDWERETAFWFLTTGASFLASGQLARWAQRRTGTLPAAFGWGLLVLGLAGATVMPRSGFWAIAANGLLALAATRAGGTRVHGGTAGPRDVTAGRARPSTV